MDAALKKMDLPTPPVTPDVESLLSLPELEGDAAWVEERARLMNLLAQQQRLAQTGLLTAGLAHEISNHVMVIAGLAFAAQRSIDPASWKEALGQIEERCRDLSQTMETILAFADRRKTTLQTTFQASHVVQEAVRLLRPLALKSAVSFSHDVQIDATIAGDERALVQALVNLGSNAIRACEGRSSHLAIRVTSGGAGTCRILVEDDGPGIPEHLRRGIFRPFTTSQTDSNGHGLGLFIVRRAIVKLGGSIRVQTSSEGTTFTVDVPLYDPNA